MTSRTFQPSSAGDIAEIGFFFLIMYGMATFFVWVAVRTWRDEDRFGRTASMMSTKVGPSIGRGLARGSAVVAASVVCLALAVTCGLFGDVGPTAGARHWIASGLIAAFMTAFPLLACIVVFNRPRFLVVPYMRHLDRAALRGGSPSWRERLSRLRGWGRSDSS